MKKHIEKWEMQKISSHSEEIVGVWAVPGGECIAVCKSGSADNDANANLIAAAPELLEACQMALNFRLMTHHGDDALLAALRAAIAKAERGKV